MKKYKFKIKVHAINFFCGSLCIFGFWHSIYFKDDMLWIILLGINSLVALYGVISAVFAYTIIDNTNIIQKTIGKAITIPLNEIQNIVEEPIDKLPITVIRVYTKTKKISISSFTKDYKELLSKIIDASSNNPNIRIESYVLQLIKYK